MQDSPLRKDALPHDLAHPRPDRASLIGNIATAAALLIALATLVTYVLIVT